MQGLETKQSSCPSCGEPIELVIDTSIPMQEYIEDCEVCCRPMIITLLIDSEDNIGLHIRSESE
jgi:hypothetical protein